MWISLPSKIVFETSFLTESVIKDRTKIFQTMFFNLATVNKQKNNFPKTPELLFDKMFEV